MMLPFHPSRYLLEDGQLGAPCNVGNVDDSLVTHATCLSTGSLSSLSSSRSYLAICARLFERLDAALIERIDLLDLPNLACAMKREVPRRPLAPFWSGGVIASRMALIHCSCSFREPAESTVEMGACHVWVTCVTCVTVEMGACATAMSRS